MQQFQSNFYGRPTSNTSSPSQRPVSANAQQQSHHSNDMRISYANHYSSNPQQASTAYQSSGNNYDTYTQRRSQSSAEKMYQMQQPQTQVSGGELPDFKSFKNEFNSLREQPQKLTDLYLRMLDSVPVQDLDMKDRQTVASELRGQSNMASMIFQFYCQSGEYDFFVRRLKNMTTSHNLVNGIQSQGGIYASIANANVNNNFNEQLISSDRKPQKQTIEVTPKKSLVMDKNDEKIPQSVNKENQLASYTMMNNFDKEEIGGPPGSAQSSKQNNALSQLQRMTQLTPSKVMQQRDNLTLRPSRLQNGPSPNKQGNGVSLDHLAECLREIGLNLPTSIQRQQVTPTRKPTYEPVSQFRTVDYPGNREQPSQTTSNNNNQYSSQMRSLMGRSDLARDPALNNPEEADLSQNQKQLSQARGTIQQQQQQQQFSPPRDQNPNPKTRYKQDWPLFTEEDYQLIDQKKLSTPVPKKTTKSILKKATVAAQSKQGGHTPAKAKSQKKPVRFEHEQIDNFALKIDRYGNAKPDYTNKGGSNIGVGGSASVRETQAAYGGSASQRKENISYTAAYPWEVQRGSAGGVGYEDLRASNGYMGFTDQQQQQLSSGQNSDRKQTSLQQLLQRADKTMESAKACLNQSQVQVRYVNSHQPQNYMRNNFMDRSNNSNNGKGGGVTESAPPFREYFNQRVSEQEQARVTPWGDRASPAFGEQAQNNMNSNELRYHDQQNANNDSVSLSKLMHNSGIGINNQNTIRHLYQQREAGGPSHRDNNSNNYHRNSISFY